MSDEPSEQIPSISILLAARNEEKVLAHCLQSLAAQLPESYQYEVWIANDGSTDATEAIALSFTSRFPHFHLHNVEGTVGKAKGKANALAQIARLAKGKWLLMTDADMLLPNLWASSMVKLAEQQQADLLTGFTIVNGSSVFAQLQSCEWAFALSLTKLSSELGFPVTAMGNNLAIRKAAYEQTGGYENIAFSVAEDFALFEAVRQAGGKSTQIISAEVTGITLPVDSWGQLLQQRKRWMQGAMQLPFFYRSLYYLQFLYLPLLAALFFYFPLWAMGIGVSKYLLTTLQVARTFQRARKSVPLKGLLIFELYQAISPLLFLPYYYWPAPVKWKGRTYFSE